MGAKEKPNPGAWTIYDIAREAGVSAKTVSRVLNSKGGVGEKTRTKILELMQRVAYHPHIGAQALRGKQRGSIGVTLSNTLQDVPLSQGFFLWLFEEVYRVFGSKGEYVCFDVNPHATGYADYARGLWEKLFKACIVAGPIATNDTTIHKIDASGLPYVALGRVDSLPNGSSATVDYEEGAYISTRYLIERGHTRIAILMAFHGFQPGVERRRGYLRALSEAGIKPDESLMRSVTFGAQNTASIVHRLLTDRDVTALIDSSGTEDATSLREGARKAGRLPGTDLEIVAWTYADDAGVLDEASAHVWLPVREAAAEGIEQLAEWLQGKRTGPIKVLYRPILSPGLQKVIIPRPKRLFDSLE